MNGRFPLTTCDTDSGVETGSPNHAGRFGRPWLRYGGWSIAAFAIAAFALLANSLDPQTAYGQRGESDKAAVQTKDVPSPSDAKSPSDGATTADAPAEADGTAQDQDAAPTEIHFTRKDMLIASLTIFLLAIFVGFEVITKVPPTLHTPLMSGSNAISGITIVGAIIVAGHGLGFAPFLGFIAVALAAVNVVGGFLVTHRMLAMFKKR